MNPSYYDEGLKLLVGLGRTLVISTLGIALGLALGIALAALRQVGVRLLDVLISAYVNLFRCTPLLVQIVMLYYAMPEVGIRLTAFETSWLALGVWGGAYHTEIFRAAFGSVSASEVMAARALGMSRLQAFCDVSLPLGLRACGARRTSPRLRVAHCSRYRPNRRKRLGHWA